MRVGLVWASGRIAQLAEHLGDIERVASSSLATSTKVEGKVMNIYDALAAARGKNQAIKEDRWNNACLYHGVDNMLRWFRGIDNPYGDNGRECTLSVALLLSNRWETTDMTTYHNEEKPYE